MNTQMLEVIDYIKNVNKKKVTVDKIVTWLNNAAPSNWDRVFCIIQDDNCITPKVDCDVIIATRNLVILTHLSDPAFASPNILQI